MVVELLDEPWSEVDDARLAAAAAFFDLPDTGPDDLPPWPEDDRAQSVAGILTLVDRLGPCSDAVMLLESLTGRELTEAQWLAVIVVWRSLLPWAEGLHLAAVAAFAGDAPPCGVSAHGIARGDDLDLAAAELGMALGVGREVALGLVHDARTLYGRCQPPGGEAALMTEANDADSLADGDDADTADSECDTADVDDDHRDDGGRDEGTSTGAAAKAAPVGPGGEGLLASTGQALLAGRLDSRRARLLVQQLGILDAEQARLAETALLPNAMRGSLSDLRRRIRYRLDKLNPDAALQRWAEARRKRSVSLDTEGDDGLVGLHAYLPPTEGLAVMGVWSSSPAATTRKTDAARTNASPTHWSAASSASSSLPAAALALAATPSAAQAAPAPAPPGQVRLARASATRTVARPQCPHRRLSPSRSSSTCRPCWVCATTPATSSASGRSPPTWPASSPATPRGNGWFTTRSPGT